jgi:DNA-directed RNA polymerase subunit RPC12/RpoP
MRRLSFDHAWKKRKSKKYYMYRCTRCGIEARPPRYSSRKPSTDEMDKKDRGLTCHEIQIRQVLES